MSRAVPTAAGRGPAHVARALAALAGLALAAAAAGAQTFPDRPIRLIAPFAPGGSTDTVARILGARLGEQLGQSVLVDNRTGAGGTIGAALAARAAPDGYTLLVGDFGPNVVAGGLFAQLPYDPVKSFTHVSLAVTFPLVLVTPASSTVGSLREYIERGRAKAGALRYGSAGIGTSPHVFMELLQFMGKTQTLHVPYKGGAPAVVGVVGGEVDSAMVAVSSAIAQLGAGKLRALAVTSAAPSPRLPGVPAVASVLAGYEGLNFHGLHAPAGLPAAIANRLADEVRKAVLRPESRERLDDLAMDPVGSTPAEYDAFIRRQVERWLPFVRQAGIRVE